jgi:hypothetical protein
MGVTYSLYHICILTDDAMDEYLNPPKKQVLAEPSIQEEEAAIEE